MKIYGNENLIYISYISSTDILKTTIEITTTI